MPASGTRSTSEAVAQALNGAPLVRVLVTHWHPDHVKGLPALRDRWSGLVVVDAAGEPVPAGDGQLEIIPTPGHSPDHLCFFDREAGDLYCGDLARKGGTIVIPARKGGDLRAYLASLQLVRDLGAAAAAAWTRPDRRRPGGAHRRVHRAPAEARAADPAGHSGRGEDGGRHRAPRVSRAARVAERRGRRQRARASREAPRRRPRVELTGQSQSQKPEAGSLRL